MLFAWLQNGEAGIGWTIELKMVCTWRSVVASDCQEQQLRYLSSKISTVIGRIHCQQKTAQCNSTRERGEGRKHAKKLLQPATWTINPIQVLYVRHFWMPACTRFFPFSIGSQFSHLIGSQKHSLPFLPASVATTAGFVYWPLYKLPTMSTESTCTHRSYLVR